MAHNITPFKYITCKKNYSIMQLLSWHTTLHLLNTSLVQRTIRLCNCYHGTQHYTFQIHHLYKELFNYAIVIMAHNITPFKYITCTKNYSIMQLLSTAHNITPFKSITCTRNYSIMQLLSWHTTLHLLNTSLVQRTIQLCNCYHGTQHYTL